MSIILLTKYQRNSARFGCFTSIHSLFYQSTLAVQVQLLAKNERIKTLLIVFLSGCRKLRHYGTNCTIPCPRNCFNGVCDIINGDCRECVAGYKGRTCNEGVYLDSTKNIIHKKNFKLLYPYQILLTS